jgi:hypothetical protein
MPQSKHHRHWRALPQFRPDACVRRLNDINPWLHSARGRQFYEDVLRPLLPDTDSTVTVAEIEARKRQLGIPDEGYGARGHIGWLWTWVKAGFPFIEIDGQVFVPDNEATPPAQHIVEAPRESGAADQRLVERLDALAQAAQAFTQAIAEIRREIAAVRAEV